jgi:hypothetical protein
MKFLRELGLLAPFYRDRPQLTGAHADYFRSSDYLARLEELGNDTRALARLSAALLEHVALDPLHGNKLEDFITVSSNAETVFVCLQLNRLVNPIGAFAVSSEAPEAAVLVQAIEKNLASRMFKAAVMHRRLAHGNTKRYRRFEKAARAAFQAAYDKAESTTPQPAYFSEDARYARMRAIRETAEAARAEVYGPLEARLKGRIHAVANQAYSADYRGGYYDILAAFASRYICPAPQAQTCCA